MCREEQPELRWSLMSACWGSLIRTQVDEPPPFPEPQAPTILLSSNGPVAYLGLGMWEWRRYWPYRVLTSKQNISALCQAALGVPQQVISSRKWNKTNCDGFTIPQTTLRHFKIMLYVVLETFISKANLFKFFAVGWSGNRKNVKVNAGLEFLPGCLLDMMLFTLKPSLWGS